MVRKVEWTARALGDLREICDFIAKDSRRYAEVQASRIQAAVSRLREFPLMGRRLPEFPYLQYREILSGDYRVLYRFDRRRSRVLVMAIVHGSRILKRDFEES